MGFIEDFIDYTKEAESPTSYFRWAAISAVSAVMRDNLYHEWQYDRLYPNLFILLVGPPAIGKSLPMKIAGRMIKAVDNTKIIEGSASIQAVVKSLGTFETGGQKGASCILYSEELSSFYVKDQMTNELLTDLSDYHETWDRNLISWQAKLSKVCMSLFAASNEVLLKSIFDAQAMYGGLLSRTLLIMEKKKRRKDPMIAKRKIIENGSDPLARLNAHLKVISKVKGQITFDIDAEGEFVEWYESWDENRGRTGIEGRMKTHIKKIAMILAMCEPEAIPLVRKRHIEYAIELCISLYRNYQILAMEGATENVHPAAIVLRMLGEVENYTLSRKLIIRNNLGTFTGAIMDETANQLVEADLIMVRVLNEEHCYCLTPKAMELYGKVKEKQ